MLASVPLESFLGTGVHAGPEGTGEGAKLLSSFLGALPPPFTPCHLSGPCVTYPPPHTPLWVGITTHGGAGLCLTGHDSGSPLGFLCLKAEEYLALFLQRSLGSHLALAYFSLPQRVGWGWQWGVPLCTLKCIE